MKPSTIKSFLPCKSHKQKQKEPKSPFTGFSAKQQLVLLNVFLIRAFLPGSFSCQPGRSSARLSPDPLFSIRYRLMKKSAAKITAAMPIITPSMVSMDRPFLPMMDFQAIFTA